MRLDAVLGCVLRHMEVGQPHCPGERWHEGGLAGSSLRRAELPGQITSNDALTREAPAHGNHRGTQGALFPEPLLSRGRAGTWRGVLQGPWPS